MEDKLSNLIARYNADKELNNLKDILDYLPKVNLFIFIRQSKFLKKN